MKRKIVATTLLLFATVLTIGMAPSEGRHPDHASARIQVYDDTSRAHPSVPDVYVAVEARKIYIAPGARKLAYEFLKLKPAGNGKVVSDYDNLRGPIWEECRGGDCVLPGIVRPPSPIEPDTLKPRPGDIRVWKNARCRNYFPAVDTCIEVINGTGLSITKKAYWTCGRDLRVITPCAEIYAEIGREVRREQPNCIGFVLNENPIHEWICK